MKHGVLRNFFIQQWMWWMCIRTDSVTVSWTGMLTVFNYMREMSQKYELYFSDNRSKQSNKVWQLNHDKHIAEYFLQPGTPDRGRKLHPLSPHLACCSEWKRSNETDFLRREHLVVWDRKKWHRKKLTEETNSVHEEEKEKNTAEQIKIREQSPPSG